MPTGVAVDAGENVYVADFGSNTIRKITVDHAVSTLAGTALASDKAKRDKHRYRARAVVRSHPRADCSASRAAGALSP